MTTASARPATVSDHVREQMHEVGGDPLGDGLRGEEPELVGERPDRSVDEEAERLSTSAAVAPSGSPGGQASSASGGYGTGSDRQSSAGTGDGTEDTSTSGEENETDWLRGAAGGGQDR